ncbi:MAG: outer-membrane lipoprotein carrier protein LolA, partial [Gemmatimonadota bacterium]
MTILVAAALAGVASTTRAQSVDRTIDRAMTEWAKVRTLRATFEQTITNPLTGSSMPSKGAYQQRRPDRLSVTFSDPKGDLIVADGKFVWVYLQSATPGQVIKMTYADAGAQNTDLIGQFLDTPRAKYDIVDNGIEKIGDRATRSLTLVAKPGLALSFIRSRVWIDTADAMIRQFESTEATGLTRKVRLLTISPNAAVDSAAFVFRVPGGVRVVEPGRT